MKQMNAEVIAIGTELLLGQIANTNTQWISRQLARQGINVLSHGVVGDNLNRVAHLFKDAEKRSDIMIVTGGLGPTEDDLTREAFQTISHLELVEHQPSMEKIKSYFKQQSEKMSPNNRRQARVFKEAKVIRNTVGMAPGMILQHAGKLWIFLPGVPSEMKQMMLEECLPYLREQFGDGSVIKSRVLRFIGIGESKLEEKLKDIVQQANPTIALLAQRDGIIARLTAKAETEAETDHLLDKVQATIEERVGTFIYGVGREKIEHKVVSMLKENHLTLSAAESLTGGMFTERIISVPDASQVCPGGIVSYDNRIKADILGVNPDTLRTEGAISFECAEEMAIHVSKNLKTNLGISFTGVAGPKSSEGHPVGTVFISLSYQNEIIRTEQLTFQGERETIRRKTVNKGLEVLYHFLKNDY